MRCKPGQRYPAAEVVDRTARSWFGEDHGLDWFREHGVIRLPRDVEEAYIGPFLDARVPIYLEHFLRSRRRAEKGRSTNWGSSGTSRTTSRCPTGCRAPSYDGAAEGRLRPDRRPLQVPLTSTAATATRIRGSTSSASGPTPTTSSSTKSVGQGQGHPRRRHACGWNRRCTRCSAKVKLTQCIHPEAVGVGGHFGHWSPGMPVARGKGINFNSLLPTDIDHIDKISTALDHCVQVKIYK